MAASPQCWARGRHPKGIARGQVDGPGATIHNAGGNQRAGAQMALDRDEIDDDNDRGKTQ